MVGVDFQVNMGNLVNMPTHAPIDEICQLLVEYTDLQLRNVGEGEPGATGRWDAVFEGPGVTFLVEYKPGSGAEDVGSALRQIKTSTPDRAKWIPLLVVPFMGEVGKELCKRSGVAWLDLSGNARITTPRLRVVVDGRPNKFAHRGRPSDPFAPKASRITRVLLLHPDQALSQSDLVRQADVDKGFVSRIVQRLEHAGLLARDEVGRVRATDPGQLLAAWRASYDFSRHEIIRAVVAARSGPDVLGRASRALDDADMRHAATGLAAAWAYEPFAAYRTAAIYVEQRPSAVTMKLMGAREAAAGTNLWMVVPNDAGVFAETRSIDGIPCVSPLQTYVDLKNHPERSEEAAEALRRAHLPWATE